MPNGKFVAYYRVSTVRQGASGLGLDAQREAVARYLNGGDWKLMAEMTEVETGKAADRPKLHDALRLCRLHKATLVIAKLDRLARNMAFTAWLMDSGVEFVAVDNPHATRLTIHILAAMAEHEAAAISTRTKDALAAAKRKGVKLGGDRAGNFETIAAAGRIAGNAARSKASKDRSADLAPTLADLRANGATSLRDLAAGLNERGFTTARGGAWSAVQVSRVLATIGG